ncbi:MAG: Cys-tRNA(Pro) deacylase [Oscillospiraceae bacterium]|jgi:Cys-tRNA(Pro)/Cys-tRNA(Cys) deacylase
MIKTNVMRVLEQKHVNYIPHEYDSDITEGTVVASCLGEDPDMVFKTLVTVSNTGVHFVFVIPVAESLDLKKAAKAVGVKSIAMIKQKELLPLTGYIHGGCSPIGMKKAFHTVIDETAQLYDTIFVSAGRVGYQVQVSPSALLELIHGEYCDLIDMNHPVK